MVGVALWGGRRVRVGHLLGGAARRLSRSSWGGDVWWARDRSSSTSGNRGRPGSSSTGGAEEQGWSSFMATGGSREQGCVSSSSGSRGRQSSSFTGGAEEQGWSPSTGGSGEQVCVSSTWGSEKPGSSASTWGAGEQGSSSPTWGSEERWCLPVPGAPDVCEPSGGPRPTGETRGWGTSGAPGSPRASQWGALASCGY